MDDTTEIVPRAGAVELVPTRNGWVPAPAAPGRRAARTARAWLRECANPTAPSTYLGPDELCLIRTHLHWLVPLRFVVQSAAMMPIAILLGFVTPSVWWWPYRAHGRCSGSGKLRSPFGGAFRRCPGCGGTGRVLRAGRRLWSAGRDLTTRR